MKSDKLFDAIGEARGEYVQDAEVVQTAKPNGWVKWAAVAACVLIAVLIAVPTLKDKAPEVEPEPAEPTPVEEPVDEPADEPVDTPASDDGENADVNNILIGGSDEQVKDGTGSMPVTTINTPRYFTRYEDFSTFIEEPVFEAFASSEEGSQHNIVFRIGDESDAKYSSAPKDGLATTFMLVDPVNMGSAYEFFHLEDYGLVDYIVVNELDEYQQTAWSTDSSSVTVRHDYQEGTGFFENAEGYGAVNSYEVNGVEIQTFDREELNVIILTELVAKNPDNPSYEGLLEMAQQELAKEHLHYARVDIDGVWYELNGYNEANVTTVAEALARVAG